MEILPLKELEETPKSEWPTFNLMLVEAGWAASFPVYPSIPNVKDIELLRSAAEQAREGKKGKKARETLELVDA